MTTATTTWSLRGDYFENCNCDVVCPCLFSPGGPLTASPADDHCDVALAFHIDTGNYGSVTLDGFNVIAVAHADGPMGGGNWSLGLYLDERADAAQREALQTVFSGAAGGPMGAFAPLVGTVLGVKPVAITYTREGKKRTVRVPGVMDVSVHAIPSMKEDGGEVWVASGYPVAPEQLAMAVGDEGSHFSDFGMSWDNSGKNGHYANINWSGQ